MARAKIGLFKVFTTLKRVNPGGENVDLPCAWPALRRRCMARPPAVLLRKEASSWGQRTDKRGSIASVLFPHTVLSYQNAAGRALYPAAQGEIKA